MSNTDQMLQEHVDSIAKDLTDPENAVWRKEWLESHDEDDEPADALAWLQDALDIEYVVSSDGKEYKGAIILVSYGGPTIYVNTRRNIVEGYWWGAEARASFEDNLGVDDALTELWETR